jgi:transposase
MMGTKARLFTPITAVSLDELVPANHFYRHLDRVVDLSFVRDLAKETYAERGRPSIDPVVFFKLQLVMFFDGIRSERQLMQIAADRLSVRWYLGYDLGEPLPDHSSLTRIRTRYGVELFRRFFDAIVEQCQQAGLVWGKELYVDATKVNANASLDSVKPRFFVEEHLKNVFGTQSEEGSEQTDQPMSQAETTASLPVKQEEMPLPMQLPTSLSPQEQEHLAQENAVRHDWIEQQGRPDRNVIRGSYRRMADFVVSTTDPNTVQIRRTGRHRLESTRSMI